MTDLDEARDVLDETNWLDLDISATLREAFAEFRGICPDCGKQMKAGRWVKWCSRVCGRVWPLGAKVTL